MKNLPQNMNEFIKLKMSGGTNFTLCDVSDADLENIDSWIINNCHWLPITITELSTSIIGFRIDNIVWHISNDDWLFDETYEKFEENNII